MERRREYQREKQRESPHFDVSMKMMASRSHRTDPINETLADPYPSACAQPTASRQK
jgi:hypothetical protein